MARRREERTPAGSTALVFSGTLNTMSSCRGNKDAMLAQPFAPCSCVEAAGGPKAATHDGELSTRCAKNSAVSVATA